MNATAKNGDVWSGEKFTEGSQTFWLYRDRAGRLYESTEAPAFRIAMNNARQVTVNGRRAIAPLS